jgi:hypothetical protein
LTFNKLERGGPTTEPLVVGFHHSHPVSAAKFVKSTPLAHGALLKWLSRLVGITKLFTKSTHLSPESRLSSKIAGFRYCATLGRFPSRLALADILV